MPRHAAMHKSDDLDPLFPLQIAEITRQGLASARVVAAIVAVIWIEVAQEVESAGLLRVAVQLVFITAQGSVKRAAQPAGRLGCDGCRDWRDQAGIALILGKQ